MRCVLGLAAMWTAGQPGLAWTTSQCSRSRSLTTCDPWCRRGLQLCSMSAYDSWQTRRAMTEWSTRQLPLCDRQVAITATQWPCCMLAGHTLSCSPRQDLLLAVLPLLQPAHAPCCALHSCWPCAGTALARSAACSHAVCGPPGSKVPASPTKHTRLQAVALVFDHVLLEAPPPAEAARAASPPSEPGQEQADSVPSSPAPLQLSLSQGRLSSLERARSTGSPRLGGAVNAALKLLEDLCMMATGQACAVLHPAELPAMRICSRSERRLCSVQRPCLCLSHCPCSHHACAALSRCIKCTGDAATRAGVALLIVVGVPAC